MNFAQFAGFQATLALPQFSVAKFHQTNQEVLLPNGIQVAVTTEEAAHASRSNENAVKLESCDNIPEYFMRFSGQPTFPSNLQTLYYKPNPEIVGADQQIEVSSEEKYRVAPKKSKKKKKKHSSHGEPYEPRKRSTSLQPMVSATVDGHTVFSCPQCHAIFNDQETVNSHMAIHRMERPFICDDCGAALKRKEHLDRHKSSHMTDRPHVCHVCSKSFKRQEHLQRHSIIHRTDKAHHCVECGKGFNRKDHLNKHVQSHLSKRLKQEIPLSKSQLELQI